MNDIMQRSNIKFINIHLKYIYKKKESFLSRMQEQLYSVH